MSFFKASLHKERIGKESGRPIGQTAFQHVLRGYTAIPGRLPSGIARFRFVVNTANLIVKMYICKLS